MDKDEPKPDCPECQGTGEVEHPEVRFYRAGPQLQSRVLGQWPSDSTYGVWSVAAWKLCLVKRNLNPPMDKYPEIGCDVARFGDCFTEIHLRWGGTSLWHEQHNGWDTGTTANQLMWLAREWREKVEKSGRSCMLYQIQIKVDDTGVGGGVTDQIRLANGFSKREQQYNIIPVAAAGRSSSPENYGTLRDQLWFETADKAARGLIDLSRLEEETLKRLRKQFMAPIWLPRGTARVVEPKLKTKERLPGLGSPDAADAVNLAYLTAGVIGTGFDSVDTSQQFTQRNRR